MTFVLASQYYVYLLLSQHPFSIVSVLNVKVLVGAFNQEKALVGAFFVIRLLKPMDRLQL